MESATNEIFSQIHPAGHVTFAVRFDLFPYMVTMISRLRVQEVHLGRAANVRLTLRCPAHHLRSRSYAPLTHARPPDFHAPPPLSPGATKHSDTCANAGSYAYGPLATRTLAPSQNQGIRRSSRHCQRLRERMATPCCLTFESSREMSGEGLNRSWYGLDS